MGIREIFKRKEDPRTKGLQNAEVKNKKTPDLILPPRDEKGRFVPDRSRQGVNLTTLYYEISNKKK